MEEAFAQHAELLLAPGTDPAAVGAAVTTALCGHWEHEGACRWPHNNDIDTTSTPVRFRTVFIAPLDEEQDVRGRITQSLSDGVGWSVAACAPRPLRDDERDLARRLHQALRPPPTRD